MSSLREWLAEELSQLQQDLDVETYTEHLLSLLSALDKEDQEEGIVDFLSAVAEAVPHDQLTALAHRIIQKGTDLAQTNPTPTSTPVLTTPTPAPAPARTKDSKKRGGVKGRPFIAEESVVFQEPEGEEDDLLGGGNIDQGSSLDLLCSIFPAMERAQLKEQLQQAGFDLKLTVARLIESLQGEQEEAQGLQEALYDEQTSAEGVSQEALHTPPGDSRRQVPSSSSSSSSSKPPVCRHFLAGTCFRADCWYSHEVQTTVCSFWLRGTCVKGERCEFLHNFDPATIPEPRSEGDQKLNPQSTGPAFEAREAEFPGLPGVTPRTQQDKRTPLQVTSPLWGKLDTAGVLRLSNLMEEFFWVSKNSVRDIFLASSSMEDARSSHNPPPSIFL